MRKYVTETFVLNPPKFELSNIDKFNNEIIYIKKDNNKYIPCLFIQDFEQCNKFLIIFHGNNEHIFELEMAAGVIREKLKMNVLVVEYPGYSIYFSKRSPKIIMEDATIVYDFIIKKFEVKDEDIFIYGRSIGSAPSIYLASKRNAKALFVVSGFSSLKEVGKGLYVGWALEDIFKNIEYISKVTIPTLFIHGKKDSLISWDQSMQLMDKCGSKRKDIKLIDNMTHNSYNLIDDIINKINSFLLNQFNDINPISNYYNLYNKKFNDLLTMPQNLSNYIDNINFKFEGYSNKQIPNTINFMILLENERIALITDNQINVCDTTNFRAYYSIQSSNKIIFANSLKNDKFLYCSNDSFIFFIKFELTSYYIYQNTKIDKYQLNTCKIIELDDNNLMAMKHSYLPLIDIKIEKENNSDKYKCELTRVKAFENMILDDIIYMENNEIAVTCSQRKLLIIYNYISDKILDYRSLNLESSSSLFFIRNQYLIILNNKDFIIFDSLFKQLYILHFCSDTFLSKNYFIPTTCYSMNQCIIMIGNNDGNMFVVDLEKIINEGKGNDIKITNNKIFNVQKTSIKNILLLKNKNLLVQTENNNIYFCYKNGSFNKKQQCIIN